jgi:ABC-type glycerol-3-phosphate transport system substrate-binding protein
MSRRKAIKSVLALAGVTGASALLQACAGGAVPTPAGSAPAPTTAPAAAAPTSAPAAQPAASGAKTVVKFAHMNSWSPEWDADLDQMTKDYTQSNAKVSVEVIKWTWSTYFATLMSSIGANEQPDVMNVGWGEVTQIGKPHGVRLEQRINKDMKDNIQESSWMSCKYIGDGGIYGVPIFEQFNRGLYYRKDFLAEAGITKPPTTWTELITAADTLKKKAPQRLVIGSANQGRAIVETLAPIYYSNKNQMVEFGNGKWNSTLANDSGKEAMQFMVDLFKKEYMAKETLGGANYIEGFQLGQYAMFFGLNFHYAQIKKAAPQVIDQVDLAPPFANKVPSNCGGAFSLNLFKQSKKQDEAWAFVEFACNKANVEKYWLPNSNMLPSRKDVKPSSFAYPDKLLTMMQEHQKVQNIFPQLAEWETIREKILTPYVTKMCDGSMDFTQGMKDIESQAKEICDRAQA